MEDTTSKILLTSRNKDVALHADSREDIVSVAESEGTGEEIAEDVAERYLNELVERYMVLVGKRDASLKIKTCRMHDLVRDLCLSKAKQENFICNDVNNIPSSAVGTEDAWSHAPTLQNLTIARCWKLKMLPVELKFITTLKELKLEEMPKAFKDKLVQGGEDYYKVQHVPSVIFQNCDD
ncbi:putative disease resistance RPP8-like protein 4 [Corchorus olitorius]|uniref:Disease resistance RPP8-like protein 4 n=1 Tax=Corchorus olitorius TaxID=93759 RepID=A0A1R3HVE6_9ROSI|nr:putative disease resistance RPP8-like protein 4 [Corchorus olitorius]